MQGYQQTFDQVRKGASELLNADHSASEQLHADFTRWVEGMVKLSNEQFDTAVQRLGASIEDLPEYLDDLNDLIGNLTPRLRA
jgi:hypothetical protein